MSEFGRDLTLSTSAQLTSRLIGLASTVVIANLTGAHNYGILSAALAISGLLMVLLNSAAGSNVLLLREIAFNKDKARDFSRAVFRLRIGGIVLLCGPLFVVIYVSGMDSHKSLIFGLAFLLLSLDSLLRINYAVFNATGHVDARALFEVGISIINFALVITVLLFSRNLHYYLYSKALMLIAGLGLADMLHMKFFQNWKLSSIDKNLYLLLLKKSIPFVGLAVSATLAVQADIICLTLLEDDKTVGIYRAATNFYLGFEVVPAALFLVFLPHLSSVVDRDSTSASAVSLVNQTLKYLLVIGSLATGVLFFSANWIVALFYSEEFSHASIVLRTISLNLVALFLSSFFGTILVAIRRERLVSVLALASASVNVFLNIVLIPIVGMVGAALATLVSTSIAAALQWGFAVRLLEHKVAFGELFGKNLVGLFVSGGVAYASYAMGAGGVIAGIVFVLSYLGTAHVVRLATREDWWVVFEVFRKR